MSLTTYTVKSGDRWDTIAASLYGDATLMLDTDYGTHSAEATLILANQEVILDQPLTPGITIRVPVIDDSQQPPNSNLLPPWKK